MTIRRFTVWCVAACTAMVLLSCGSNNAVNGKEPTTKDRSDYNRSMAELMGGVAKVKTANSAMLKAAGDHMLKMVSIQQQKETVRAARMENDMKAAQNFYALRQKNRDYRNARRPKRLTTKQMQSVARDRLPAQLSSFSTAQTTRNPQWPAFLTRTYFVNQRQQIQTLMAQRTQEDSGAGSESSEKIQAAVASIRTELKKRVREVSPAEYLAAKRFLDGVALDARSTVLSPVLNSVASN